MILLIILLLLLSTDKDSITKEQTEGVGDKIS